MSTHVAAEVRCVARAALLAEMLLRIGVEPVEPHTFDMEHPETHRTHRVGWLRAAVLGANDGIISTASLVVGVAASDASRNSVLVAGVAGLVAGAMAMATGEYVSVSSQADSENADLEREREELKNFHEEEHQELAAIYVGRGLTPDLAQMVAQQLMAHDALGAHARDELGISEVMNARPVQAAMASAATFTIGAALPLIVVLIAPHASLPWAVSLTSLVFLATLGATAAYVGGSGVFESAARVTFWGALAMLLTAAVGSLFGVAA